MMQDVISLGNTHFYVEQKTEEGRISSGWVKKTQLCDTCFKKKYYGALFALLWPEVYFFDPTPLTYLEENYILIIPHSCFLWWFILDTGQFGPKPGNGPH